MKPLWLALAWLPLGCLAATDERAAIVAERQALQARFAEQEQACAARFVVNACLEDVRLRRRAALEPLRERELRLDQADRLRRADERRAFIAAKQQGAAAAAASGPSTGATPQLRVRDPAAVPVPVPAAPPERLSGEPTGRTAEAAARAREAEQRRAEAQAAQQRVQQRQAERAASGKSRGPLPMPPAASAPRR